MKLVLVRPNIPMRWLITPPLGIQYISAVAKKAGHDVVIHDAWLKNETPEAAAQYINYEFDTMVPPRVIGIQVFSDTVEWTREFITYLRRYNRMYFNLTDGVKIIIGGPYVSAVGRNAMEETDADAAIIGEFDNYTSETLEKIIELPRGKKRVYFMSRTDINKVPIPDWEAAPPSDYWPYLYSVSQPVKGKRIAVIQRTRGCPSACTFCSAGFTLGRRVRFRDDNNVLEEIGYLQDRWNINEIWFSDDNFIVDYDRGVALFEKLAQFKNLHVRLPLGIRIENVDEKMVHAMKAANVYFTGIGIESGNARVLSRIKKRIRLDKVETAVALLNKHKITTIGFFIFGLPTETRIEMKDTVEYAMSTKLNQAQFGTFIPYPGAEDYHERPLLPEHELIKIQRNATLKFYLRPRIIWGLIKHFRFSQIKAFWTHNWIIKWTGRRK